MKHFFVITGPSACGKTTLLKRGRDKEFWKLATKYSTRDERLGDDFDDIIHLSKDEIYESETIDYRYIMNDNIYAFSSADILQYLRDNETEASNVAIVCSDLGIIRRLKHDPNLKDYLVVLFISTVPATKQVTKAWLDRESGIAYNSGDKVHPNFDKLNNLNAAMRAKIDTYYSDYSQGECQSFEKFSDELQSLYEEYVSLMPKSSSYKRRIRNIDKFYYKYVEEIGFFDYTILNFFDPAGDKLEDERMTCQVDNIIKYLDNGGTAPAKRQFGNNALFFICAPKRAGKAILFSNLNLMSRDKIEIVRKIALREDKNNEEDLKLGKGDGFGLSETYWMFDSQNDREYEELERLKKESGDECNWDNNEQITNCVQELLTKANVRVNNMVQEKMGENFKPQNYSFTDWYWHFQGNYYAVDTASIVNSNKHSIVISNIDQLEKAMEWAKEANKIFVPIFLVYVDFYNRSKEYHMSLYPDEPEKGIKMNERIFETIDNYYANIGKFRHVILNNGIAEDVHDQISNIINQYK